MESRKLAALLSSLVSQLILIILLIFPPSQFPHSNSPHQSDSTTFSLIHHFLLSQQSAAAAASILTRKRKRLTSAKPDPPPPGPLNRTPDWFPNTFLMTSSTFEWLTGLLEPLLECRDPADHPLNLSAGVRLGIGLFRLANGSDYLEISNRFGVSVTVAKFCVKQLCRVLCTNFRFWISFPNQNDLRSVSNGFESLSGLHNCCGVVSCSRFQVSSSSIAAQIVVDSTWRVLSIAAGFHGNKTNSVILKASSLFQDIQEGTLLNASPVNGVNQYLIGDSGYPLLPWLMVPFADALTVPGSVEENFNASNKLMRLSAHRTEASLRKWGVLSRPVKEELKMAVAYIGACAILHNSLLMREDFTALAGGDEFEDWNCGGGSEPFALEDDPVTAKALVMRATLADMAKKIC